MSKATTTQSGNTQSSTTPSRPDQSRSGESSAGKAEDAYNGLLVVDKPGRTRLGASTAKPVAEPMPKLRGDEKDFPTSHDVVQMVRRWSKTRRIGHTGTLDPLASGVLVLCIGPSTRLVEYYQGHPKTYYAEIVLGAATDTYDAFGNVLEESAIPELTSSKIETTLDRFRGTIQQKPPIFSALKQAGESIHRKARRGEAIEVKPRQVTFYSIDLLDLLPPNRILLRTTCSAGTYIRSLAHDLGQALGTSAYLDILRREAAGPFTLDDASSLPTIKNAAADNQLSQLLRPPGDRLSLSEITLTEELVTRFGYGQKVVLELPDSWMQDSTFVAQLDTLVREVSEPSTQEQNEPIPKPILAKAVDANRTFLGIVSCLGYARARDVGSESADETLSVATVWKAEKWFAT